MPVSNTTLDQKANSEFLMIDEWTLFVQVNGLTVYQRYVDEIRFGPAFFDLKSDPSVEGLVGNVFGNWFALYNGGILLQKWNSLREVNASLLFISSKDSQAKILVDSIPSVFWDFTMEGETSKLICNASRKELVYEIDVSIN